MVEALEMLKKLVEEWKTEPTLPEIDWSRIRGLDFQDTLQSRNSLAQRLTGRVCLQCPDFATHVRCTLFFIVNDPDAIQYSIMHREKMLRTRIAELKMRISDQNLELIPDYEQRIEVLKALKFIDENSTVLLKGRVACEVCSLSLIELSYWTRDIFR